MVRRSDWKRFALAGALCIGVSQLLFIGGLARTSVAHLIILASMSPLMAAMFRWAFRGQRPDRISALGMLVGFVGVIVVVGDAGSSEGTSVLGDLMALGAAATWVGATVLPQPLVTSYGALRATAWLMVAASALVVPVGALAIVETFQHPPPFLAWASLVYTALALDRQHPLAASGATGRTGQNARLSLSGARSRPGAGRPGAGRAPDHHPGHRRRAGPAGSHARAEGVTRRRGGKAERGGGWRHRSPD